MISLVSSKEVISCLDRVCFSRVVLLSKLIFIVLWLLFYIHFEAHNDEHQIILLGSFVESTGKNPADLNAVDIFKVHSFFPKEN